MTDGMREQRWFYPPDYVSAETLAYRLDCSRSTIDAYVRLGLLPKPETIGNLQRWDFGQVKAFIKAQNTAYCLHRGGRKRQAPEGQVIKYRLRRGPKPAMKAVYGFPHIYYLCVFPYIDILCGKAYIIWEGVT